MMAKLNYLNIAPRKVRLVADLIRGKSVEQAQKILNFTYKRASAPILKLLNSAVANAKNNFQKDDIANLYISKLLVNEGPKHKRWRPVSRGRANEFRKRTSHIVLVLDEIDKKREGAKKSASPKTGAVKGKEIKRQGAEPEAKKALPGSAMGAKAQKPKPRFEKQRFEAQKPGSERGLKRVFRRKAF